MMKNRILSILLLLFVSCASQNNNPLILIKGNPMSYTEELYQLKNKNKLTNLGEPISKKTFSKRLKEGYVEDYYEEGGLSDSTEIIKNKDNQIIKKQEYNVYSDGTSSRSDQFTYLYDDNKRLKKIEHFYAYDLEKENPIPSYSHTYQYNNNGQITRIIDSMPKRKLVNEMKEFTYKNGLPVQKTFSHFSSFEEDNSDVPIEQSFEFYVYDKNGRLVEETVQYYTIVSKRKIYYNIDNTIEKMEIYNGKVNHYKKREAPHYAPKNGKYYDENDPKNKLKLLSVNYYKKYDGKGNPTEIVSEIPKKSEEDSIKYFVTKRTYEY